MIRKVYGENFMSNTQIKEGFEKGSQTSELSSASRLAQLIIR